MLDTEVMDVIELTELFAPWLNLVFTEEMDGLEPCVGVAGEDAAAAEAPNNRRVDENRREGRRRDEEYYGMFNDETSA